MEPPEKAGPVGLPRPFNRDMGKDFRRLKSGLGQKFGD
ncbi:unnamed protein product [Ciceribacter sp. T2.26MG-112.2]|nr:unnamed protein product [Ciceribacter naphthalenivorans]